MTVRPNSSPAQRPLSRFRLAGLHDQREHSFPLLRGKNVLGNHPSCDICLQEPGISRRHAQVDVRERSLTVTDLSSKNGTLLNGRPIRSAQMVLGDELDLCGLTLSLEGLHPDDARLGLSLGERHGSAALWPGDTTQLRLGAGVDDGRVVACLQMVEALWGYLRDPSDNDLEQALRCIVEASGAEGAAILEKVGGGHLLVTGVGSLDRLQLDGLEVDLPLSAGESDMDLIWVPAGEGELGVALFGGPASRARALWAKLVAGWLASRRPLPGEIAPAGGASGQDPQLVFPAAYVRGESPAMRSVYAQLRHLTQGDVPVLVVGDTGVGKELLARTLHLSSGRHGGPMITINCAAIPADLLESELFGIDRGVATGVSARLGRIQQANGGTLFLDEIGDMPSGLQAKLLRVLQEREVQPLGGKPVKVDVRVVAATNTELQAAIDAGSFRRDLYYRLAGYVLRLPSLADRREDIPLLVEHFLRVFSAEIHKPIRGVTVAALQRLAAYGWPGNIRQLEHEVRRMVYLAGAGQAIDSYHLSPELRDHGAPASGLEAPARDTDSGTGAVVGREGDGAQPGASGQGAASKPVAGGVLPTLELEALEKLAIEAALERSDGTLTDAAARLGISRDALRRRLIRHGLRGKPE